MQTMGKMGEVYRIKLELNIKQADTIRSGLKFGLGAMAVVGGGWDTYHGKTWQVMLSY